MDESFAGCFLRVKSGLGGVIWPLLLLRLCSQMTRTVASTMPPAWHCGLAPARTAPPNSSRHAICDRSTRRHATAFRTGILPKQPKRPSKRACTRSLDEQSSRIRCTLDGAPRSRRCEETGPQSGRELKISQTLDLKERRTRRTFRAFAASTSLSNASHGRHALSPRRRASATHPTAATRFRRVDEPHQRIPRPRRKDAPPTPPHHRNPSVKSPIRSTANINDAQVRPAAGRQ